MSDKSEHLQIDYWKQYSDFNSWHFWFLVSLLILSLACLYFLMDRKKALLLGFYGFNIHVWFSYLTQISVWYDLWSYPYKIFPFFPGFTTSAAFFPVGFMLIYQWTLNHNKNYYLYATGFCLFIAFLWKPTLSTIDLFQVKNKISYLYVFFESITVMLISKWISNIFVHFQKNPEHPLRKEMNLKILARREKARWFHVFNWDATVIPFPPSVYATYLI